MALPEPITRKEMYLSKAATGEGNVPPEPVTREEMYLAEIAAGGGGGGGGALPSASWTATVSTGFEAQDVTATVMGNSFTKVSDKAFTYDQLDGAVFAMGGGTIPLDSSMLSDMSAAGVTGTLITLPSPYGPIMFSCTEAGSVVSEPGFYLATAAVSYAPQVTMSYTETLTAETRAIGVGTMEMEDGVTDLPSGVVYLQIEG